MTLNLIEIEKGIVNDALTHTYILTYLPTYTLNSKTALQLTKRCGMDYSRISS